MAAERLPQIRRDGTANNKRIANIAGLLNGDETPYVADLSGYKGDDYNLQVDSSDTVAGLIAKFSAGGLDSMTVTKDGVTVDALEAASIQTETLAASVGVTTLDLVVTNDAAISRDVGIGRHLAVNGNTQFGNADTDASIVFGTLTVRNAAGSLFPLYADAANGRTIVGATTALTSAADDRFAVVGGISYFAGNSGASIGIRYSAAETAGWTVGESAAGANADLVFKDDGATETFRVGDAASLYQAKVTGDLNVTDDAVVGGDVSCDRLVIGDTTFSGTERLRVVGDSLLEGAVTATGLLTVSGGQIAFPATQSASTDANTLDDYEEGTWTPSVGGTATYTTQAGAYIKIGRVVVLWGQLQINTIGTGSTSTISGLPFAADNNASGAVDTWTSLAVNVTSLYVVTSGSTVLMKGTTAAAASNATVNVLGNSALVRFTVVYRTAS